MRKLRYSLVTLLLAFLSASATADNVKYLVIDLTDGSQTVVALADQPSITCQAGELKVTVAGEDKLTAALDQVRHYAFSAEVPTSIQSFAMPSSRFELGHVYLSNVEQNETVRVFSASGRLVKSVRIGDNGTADIDLTDQGKGLYIVKSKHSSIKVINQ